MRRWKLPWLTKCEVIAASPIKVQLNDWHVWRVGNGKFACILSLATDNE